MEKTINELSDNVYYADQLGTVQDQINFLDSLNFTEPSLIYDSDSNHDVFLCLAHTLHDGVIVTRLVRLIPSMPLFCQDDSDFVIKLWPRKFGTFSILDIKAYLKSRGFSINSITYKFKKLCVEEDLAAADTAAVEDAASLSPTEVLECGK